MNVSGILVACQAGRLEQVIEALRAFEWADVHQTDAATGRFVATIEAEDTEQAMSRLREVQQLEHVVMAEMAGHYVLEE